MSLVAAAAGVARLDEPARLHASSRTENFPVALRVLPREPRRHLLAIYAVARLIDDVGDRTDARPTDRLARLDELAADLLRIWTGELPASPVLQALAPTVGRCGLTPEPFLALVEANRVDQRRDRYPTYADLLDYCALSAAPVGRLVLQVFGVEATPDQLAASDAVCRALQVLEHCQDVGEDRRERDRIYLPLEDLNRFGVEPADLDAAVAGPQVRALVRFECDRAAALLAHGTVLVRQLRGWPRLAVCGYVAGGLATLDALRRADGEVLAQTVRPRRRDVVLHAMRLLAVGR